MSVSSKTRAALNLAGKKPADLAECLGTSVQGVRNKFSKDTFSVSDLLKISEYLGCELILDFKNGQTVHYTIDDVKDSEKTVSKSQKTDAEKAVNE